MEKTNYSIFERKIASFLRKFPFVKRKAKFFYQYINFVLYRKKQTYITDYAISRIELNEVEESFLGYYDKSPLNIDEDKIIFHSTSFSTKVIPSADNPIKVVLKDFKNDIVLFVDENVFAYNWQQGSRLQWLNSKEFIYNSYDSSICQHISKIISSETLEEKIIFFPVYDCHKDFGISLNFERLDKLRPDYGYRNRDKRFLNYNDDNDGLFFVDFKSNTHDLIVSINQLKKLQPKVTMKNANHKVNHIMISPNGKKVMFLHRWFLNDVKFDRLLVMDVKGGNIQILLDDDMVSHCFWKDDETIIGFARKDEDKYHEINIITETVNSNHLKSISNFGDGHPNIFNNKILFDTYPDRSRMKNLFIFDIDKQQLDNVGSFFESFDFKGETRCDLHPRWSQKGSCVFIDSVHENKRKLYLLNKRK